VQPSLEACDVGAPLTWTELAGLSRTEKTEPNPAISKTKEQLTEELLQSKRSLAFDAFRAALDTRLKQEGKLKLMPDKLKGFGTFG